MQISAIVIKHIRLGAGKPLLLVHGLGGSGRSWRTIIDALALQREVIAIDLPGFGATPPLAGEVSMATLADALTDFLRANGWLGIDAVGSSMGARLVMELARRGGVLGAVIALDPGGFWRGWQRHFFFASLWLSIRLVRLLQPVMPFITANKLGRILLLAQFSADPGKLSQAVTLEEMRSYAASPSFDELLHSLAYGAQQQGARQGKIAAPLVIGWGRQDHVCPPGQSELAALLFPDASLHWFDDCGHFPHWDSPEECVQLILDTTSGKRGPSYDAGTPGSKSGSSPQPSSA